MFCAPQHLVLPSHSVHNSWVRILLASSISLDAIRRAKYELARENREPVAILAPWSPAHIGSPRAASSSTRAARRCRLVGSHQSASGPTCAVSFGGSAIVTVKSNISTTSRDAADFLAARGTSI